MSTKPPVSINRCGLTYPDKVVIVTGGSKGIGEGCARVFVDAGAKVVICARGDEAGKKLVKELNEKGPGRCDFIQCDVSKPEDIKRMIDESIKLHGRLDCLINNAGYHPPHKAIDDFRLDELSNLFQTDFVSLFVASQYALPHLRKVKGNIINMGSLAAVIGQEAATTYCAIKAAVSAFTKSLAIEETRHNVRVNCVVPGNILSYGREQLLNTPEGTKYYNWIDTNQPGGRSGTNEEVGQLCLFLASDAAAYLTGIEIIISGGSELGYGVKWPLMFIR